MADDLTILEKRTGSFRLNLADAGVVYKSVFAKGTITDVKIEEEDPGGGAAPLMKVKSLVKVQVEGADESDFIPLFYHPKLQFWDNPDYQAQDLDQDQKCYKAAWMSFRIGDEVAVMVEDGVPVFVLGFADNNPRIGENIGKLVLLSSNEVARNKFSTTGTYVGGDTGPDGKDLGLKLECPIQYLMETPDDVVTNQCQFMDGFSADNFPLGLDYTSVEYYDIWQWTKVTLNWRCYAILLPIGSILYRYTFMVLKTTTELKMLGKYTFVENASANGPYTPAWRQGSRTPGIDPFYVAQGETPPDGATEIPFQTINNPPSMFVLGFLAQLFFYKLGWLESPGIYHFPGLGYFDGTTWHDNPNETAPPGQTLIYYIYIGPFQMTPLDQNPMYAYSVVPGGKIPADIPALTAAKFKEELLTNPTSPDFKIYSMGAGVFDQLLPPSFDEESEGEDWWNNADSKLQAFVRPHTKEDLQAAGLWPNSN